VLGLTDYLQGEFSFGRWSGDDVFALTDPLLTVVARISTHYYFAVNRFLV
jgi:hypothetical protein